MEDNNRFVPTFGGAPHFRLPFRSVYMPVVPCVLDGCLSLLELIAKLEYIINQYHDAIEANHTDIVNLATYIDGALDDLREYIDTQDAATLAAAKAYTDSAITTLTAYIDAQDAATLAAAQAYADTQLTVAKAYTDAQVGDLRAYTDAQLALKQDLLTFDFTPTDGSQNPVTSNGVYDAIYAVSVLTQFTIPAGLNRDTRTVTVSGITYADISNMLENQKRPVVIAADTIQNSLRVGTLYFTLIKSTTTNLTFAVNDPSMTGTEYISIDSSDVWSYTV